MELRIVQRTVESALLYKGIVVSLLYNSAVLYHKNGVGILDGGKPVCNNKAGLVLHQLGHSALYLYLCAGVNV